MAEDNLEDMISIKVRFNEIVSLKARITNYEKQIRKFTAYDKNGSHASVIMKYIDLKRKVKEEFDSKLGSLSYEEWKKRSAKACKFILKHKQTKK